MNAIESPARIWSDPEVRKVSSLLAIVRDCEELARSAAASDDLELSREYARVRGSALSTLRALISLEPVGGAPDHEEDELEKTHPGVRRPPGTPPKR